MNSLLLFAEEQIGKDDFLLSGERARLVQEREQFAVGEEIHAALIDSTRGTLRVVEVSDDRVRLSGKLEQEPPSRMPVDLVCAICRPQTTRKILMAAASFGVRSLTFVRCSNAQKSYLDSKALQETEIRSELIKGLEQVGDSVLPQVRVERRFKVFMEDVLPAQIQSVSTRLVLQEPRSQFTAKSMKQVGAAACIAVGPESGWTDYELELFQHKGFELVTLGPRSLRIEHACVAALGNVSYE